MILIIGNGASSISAIETIRSIDKNIKITLISRDKIPYSPCALPSYISNEIKRKELFREKFYKENNIKFIGGNVMKVVPKENSVVLENGKKISYDKLLIAVGSSPLKPKIKGIENSYFLGNLEDAEKIKKKAKNSKNVVIVGAGFIGIETAIALQKLGLKVKIIEMLDKVLPRILDYEIAEKIKIILEKKGIEVLLKEQVIEIKKNEVILKGQTLESSNDKIVVENTKKNLRKKFKEILIKTDFTIVAIGVKPNIEIAKDELKTNFGIIVNEKMQTSVENIFACGDVAEFKKLNAIHPSAVYQGRVAGYNLIGIEKSFEEFISANTIDIFGKPIFSCGKISSEVESPEIISQENEKSYMKLILKDNKIAGYQTIGDLRNSGLIFSSIAKGQDVSKFKNKLLENDLRNILK